MNYEDRVPKSDRESRAIKNLDIEQPNALLTYLKLAGYSDTSEQPIIRVLAGGISNRTVLVTFPSGKAWVLKQALEKLRVQVDWYSDPGRIHREALGLRWLRELAPPETITPLLFEDHDQHLLAMEAVPEPHENWKTMLLDGRVEEEHVEQFGLLLGAIHRNAHERRKEMAEVFDDRSFFESLRLEPYYGYAAEQVTASAKFLRALVEETRTRRDTLVHGDYSPKNVLVNRGRLVLLDHEVIHFGDPAFDLGFSLTHFLSKAHHLPDRRGTFADAAKLYWRTYLRVVGEGEWTKDLEARAVRHTLGCLLSRVAGRSPLEYLDDAERARQREAVLALMQGVPTTVPRLVDRFTERL
jgi:aminoglycoside phosphotransferase (APT) family kinase protein